MRVRDFRRKPLPNDQVMGPKLKARVLGIGLDKNGWKSVTYCIALGKSDYNLNYTCTVTMAQWYQLCKSERLVFIDGDFQWTLS